MSAKTRSGSRTTRGPRLLVGLALAVISLLASTVPTAAQAAPAMATEARWFMVNGNAITNANREAHVDLINEAADLGYNGVLLRASLPKYRAHLPPLAAAADEVGLDVIVTIGSLGQCQAIIDPLGGDINLAVGHKTRTRMKLESGSLVPFATPPRLISTPGSDDFSLTPKAQTTVKYDGLTPDTQYRVRFSYNIESSDPAAANPGVKMNVTGVSAGVRERDVSARLSNQANTGPGQAVVTFNSRQFDTVFVDIQAVGSGYQSIDTDNVIVEATPTLNMINRPNLFPTGLHSAEVEIRQSGHLIDTLVNSAENFFITDVLDGSRVPLGGDTVFADREAYAPISVTHEPPSVVVPKGSAIWANNAAREYYLTVYHAQPHLTGGVNSVACNWNDPGVIGYEDENSEWQHGLFGQFAQDLAMGPGFDTVDGVLLAVDEVRDGGYEGLANADFSAALASSVTGIAADIKLATRDRVKIYAWSDMFDNTVHASQCFNIVAGSLASPTPLPDDITLVNWDESKNKSFDHTCPGVVPNDRFPDASCDSSNIYVQERFESLFAVNRIRPGQIIGAYYEAGLGPRATVGQDHCFWSAAWDDAGSPSIGGAIYTTWYPNRLHDYDPGPAPDRPGGGTCDYRVGLTSDYCPHQNLADFAKQWWGQIRLVRTSNGSGNDTFWAVYTDDDVEWRMWMGREGNDGHPVVACRRILEGLLGYPEPPVKPWSFLRDLQRADHNQLQTPSCGGLMTLRDFG